jgi:MOSC domain-containing protein YiiM
MAQNKQQGGILRPDEIARAQNEMNQTGSTGGAGTVTQGGMVKPGDKIEAQNAITGTQSGGMVKAGDKIEAQSEMFKQS